MPCSSYARSICGLHASGHRTHSGGLGCNASKALEVITSWLILIALQKALHRIEEDRAVGTLWQRQPGTEGERFRHGERGPNHIGRECSHQLPLREAKAPPDSAKGDGMACRTSHLLRKSGTCVLGDASIEGQIKAALRAAPRKQLKRASLSCTGIRVDTQTFSLQEHFPSLFLLCYRFRKVNRASGHTPIDATT